MKPILFICVCLLLHCGCSRRTVEKDVEVFKQRKSDMCLAIVVDLSSSFAYAIRNDDPTAFNFFLGIIEKYKRDRAGYQDRIVIAQLSGSEKSFLFDGFPGDLKKAFATKEQFKARLLSQSDARSSNVYSAINRTLSYLNRSVAHADTKVVTIVLSDLLDNSATQEADKAELVDTMKKYCTRGTVGYYWVDETAMNEWDNILREVGFDPVPLWTSFQYRPPLPNFIND